MQAFEILQIAIKKWVLIVPLYFKRDCPRCKCKDMIDLVRLRFSLDAVDNSLDHKIVFLPAVQLECIPKSLRPFCFSSA